MRVCAWCGLVYGYRKDVEETHGICVPCLFEYFPEQAPAIILKQAQREQLEETYLYL